MNPWPRVKHLFDVDDGMLPDIYVENLTAEQIVVAYEWVMSQCLIAYEPTLWSTEEEISLPIRGVQYPAREFIAGRVETFRHCLAGLVISSVEIPQLSVSVESGGISFDYRAGEGWNEETVLALFEFLFRLKERIPNARIFQADEGGYSNPNSEFSEALSSFEPVPSNPALERDSPEAGCPSI